MKRLLLSLLLLLVPVVAGAQGNTNTVPPMCTAATLLTTCVPQVQGTIARITDAASANVCTGGGTTDVTCQYNGSTWGPMATITATGGVWTGANGETMDNSVDNQILFTRAGSGSINITSADADATAGLSIYAGGTAQTTLGFTTNTQLNLLADGGTVVVDGFVRAQKPVVSLASGALTLNTVHLATAGPADYDIPDGACDAAADVGNWVTVVLEDASTVISITSDDASNVIYVPGLGLGAGDELDSVSTAAHEGQSITLTCLAAEGWYMTAGNLNTGGGAAIAWADGGVAD